MYQRNKLDYPAYAAMWPLVTDFNYFESVSTVMNQSHFQVVMFTFNTVLLYDDYYYIIQGIANMCST